MGQLNAQPEKEHDQEWQDEQDEQQQQKTRGGNCFVHCSANSINLAKINISVVDLHNMRIRLLAHVEWSRSRRRRRKYDISITGQAFKEILHRHKFTHKYCLYYTLSLSLSVSALYMKTFRGIIISDGYGKVFRCSTHQHHHSRNVIPLFVQSLVFNICEER